MSTWKQMAVQSFPEHSTGFWAFKKRHMNIYQVFFALKEDAETYIQTDNQEGLERIFKFTEWCFDHQDRNPDIWNAAATAFLEHLADDDSRAAIIPNWVRPDIFQAMQSEFQMRRERDGEGKYQILLEMYNQVRSTNLPE
jgi:hypothetical protein